MTLPAARTLHLDRLGTLLSLVGVASFWLLPFVVFKLNRIVSGHPRALIDVLPQWSALTFYATLMLVAVIAVAVGNARIRLLAALLGMLNSCSPNVTVVNIDNGFGAAYVATLINRVK